jgi:hypothetical protein
MSPRRSARVAALAERASSALSPLPLTLVLHIFSLLPVDARACAACVCRGWGAVLSEVSLWTRLNLSPSSGVRVRVTDAVLAGAAAKARGQLAALDVLSCDGVSFDALLGVVTANAAALRELRAGARDISLPQTLTADLIELMLQAAPQLVACHADVLDFNNIADTRRMLRNEPPFQPLRLHALLLTFDDNADEASVLQLAADLAAHASLKRVYLLSAPLSTLAALDAVVDAALTRHLNSLHFWYCELITPAATPALTRLLGSDTLKELTISQEEQLLDGPSAALVGDALRANSTLTSFDVRADLWHDMDAAAALLGALTGHSSLRTLKLSENDAEAGAAAVGAALGALVVANAHALTELDVSSSNLGDAGLRPLLDALPHNKRLRTLSVDGNGMSEAFARDVLLPAVRANTSLRKLLVPNPEYEQGGAFLREAQALLAVRGAVAAVAE